MMVSHAEALGANAIIGIRYDATELMQGVTEVLCYGTAVVVESGAGVDSRSHFICKVLDGIGLALLSW